MATRIKDIFFQKDIGRVILDISIDNLVTLYGLAWSEFEKDLDGSVYKLIKQMNARLAEGDTESNDSNHGD